ncbi:hypothetical protein [Streptomyces phaeoluteigriseus]|uniref:hypothetical protein n=1 Tax=Streptomyces phaeoluteigriseus TaxID=114686 RepID=UPI001FE47F28|nr:hypothetical protein [Streptomyces phaeoluteigriseus]
MTERKSSQDLPQPLRAAASVLSRVPGAGTVGRAAEGALDKVGAVSPRGRRLAVYTGAGVLGVAGVVEWPVAVTGAAVAWLTQPRPQQGARRRADGGTAGDASGTPPTPKVLATAPPRPPAAGRAARGTTAHGVPTGGAAEPATPSDKLPSHHATPQDAGRGDEGR